MRVFISWAGERSGALARALRDWLPSVIQSIEPFFSTEDIPKGAPWSNTLLDALRETRFAIVCVKPEAKDSLWLSFEAGAAANALGSAKVAPVLYELENAELTGPLSIFQTTEFVRADMRRLIGQLATAAETRLTEPQIEAAFEVWWPRLEERLKTIPQPKDEPVRRSVEEIAAETLSAVREHSVQLGQMSAALQVMASYGSQEGSGAITPLGITGLGVQNAAFLGQPVVSQRYVSSALLADLMKWMRESPNVEGDRAATRQDPAGSTPRSARDSDRGSADRDTDGRHDQEQT